MKYRIEENVDNRPTTSTVVCQATDKAAAKSIFTLYILHVLACQGHTVSRGFMPTVRYGALDTVAENGDVFFGEDETSYKQARSVGLEMLKRHADESEKASRSIKG